MERRSAALAAARLQAVVSNESISQLCILFCRQDRRKLWVRTVAGNARGVEFELKRDPAEVALRVGPRVIALTVACAMFMAQLDSSVVLVAVPAMARSFAVRPVDLSSGITVYILVQAVLLPASHWIAERCGARRVFVTALVWFSFASICCGASRTFSQFIISRVLQGGAAALMTPVARIILLQATPKEDLVSATAISTVPMLLAPTLGPALGGLITTYGSWPWIFFLNLPFAALAVVLARRFIPPSRGEPARAFDGAGFTLIAASIVGVLSGLDWIGSGRPRSIPGALLIVLGALFGAVAACHLRRHPHPILSLRATRIQTYFVATLGGGALVRLPVRAAAFVLPLLFQFELGYSAFQAGLLLLAMNGGDLVLKIITTHTLRRYGFRNVLLGSGAATVLLVAACALLSAATPGWLIVGILAACGMARSLLFTGMSTLAFADVPHEELGSASVLWNMAQQVTSALGVSIAALTLNAVAALLGQPAGYIGHSNCQVVLVLTAAIGALSLKFFASLPPMAGAAVSGHRG
jgi:EmrB/QacA subfamily drug resistance transporter